MIVGAVVVAFAIGRTSSWLNDKVGYGLGYIVFVVYALVVVLTAVIFHYEILMFVRAIGRSF